LLICVLSLEIIEIFKYKGGRESVDLNTFHSDDGNSHQEWKVVTRKAGPVVPVDVALDELLSKRWLREKPVLTDIMHGQPPILPLS